MLKNLVRVISLQVPRYAATKPCTQYPAARGYDFHRLLAQHRARRPWNEDQILLHLYTIISESVVQFSTVKSLQLMFQQRLGLQSKEITSDYENFSEVKIVPFAEGANITFKNVHSPLFSVSPFLWRLLQGRNPCQSRDHRGKPEIHVHKLFGLTHILQVVMNMD